MAVQDIVGPLVSVVIPNLNSARYLVATIESVLHQDYPHMQCIVIDGGSTDGSLDILSGYGHRLEWVSEPDKGHADAINKGFKRCSGQILTWLAAGDIHMPRAVSQAAEYLQAHPEVDVVYGDCVNIDTDGNVKSMSYLHEWDLEYAVEHCDHCIPQPAAFIRRRILEQVGWLDATIAKQDHELWLRIGLVGTIRHIPVILGGALDHRDSVGKQGKLMARSCVQLTKKFYTLPNVPEGIRKKQRRALSNSYLRGFQYAWVGGRRRIVLKYAVRAMVADPSNSHRVLGHLINLFLPLRVKWLRAILRPISPLLRKAGHLRRTSTPWDVLF